MTVPRLELGQEQYLPNETELVEQIAQISERLIHKNEQNVAQREQHPKQFGCLWAEFTVEPNLPETLRVGLFKEAKTYQAWVRVSSLRQQDDRTGDAHGLAIKLMDVPGEKVLEAEKHATTHDLLFTDHPVFLIRNLPDYVEFFKAGEEAHGKPPFKFLFPSLNPFKWRWTEAKILLVDLGLIKALTKISSPLAIQYWSMTPYKLGDRAIKFFIKPAAQNQTPLPKTFTKDYLRESLSQFLLDRDAQFDFVVQLQTDPDKMPIEDPTVKWVGCPEYKVATIRIPKQRFDTEAQFTFGENLAFTPWHCLPEHRPLGSVNRTRKMVYERTSYRRTTMNGVTKQEPTPDTFAPQLLE
jgi:Catalase